MDRVVVQLDTFPSRATVMSTSYDQVRVVIADGRLQFYRLEANGVRTLYDKPVTGSVSGSVYSGVSVETEDGVVWVESTGGCGCGSQLKIADLFPGRQRVMIPLNS